MEIDIWKRELVRVIESIGDKEYQARSWFGNSVEVSSPIELFCELFDDFLFIEFLNDPKNGLSDCQESCAKKFADLLDDYSSSSEKLDDISEVFNDPKWDIIRRKARRLAQILKEDPTDH